MTLSGRRFTLLDRGRRPALLRSSIVFGLVLLLSCADKTPVKIAFSAPPAPVVDNALHTLEAAPLNSKYEKLDTPAVSYALRPEGIFEISSKGGLRCLKAGDATLTMTAGPLSMPVSLKCRLPTEIVMPQDLKLVLGNAPVELRARALGEGGRPLDEVPVLITSSNPAVVTVEGGKAKPVAVGRARLQGSVGGIVAIAPIEVDEKIVSERLVLADGAARSFSLQDGDYAVTIDMKPDVPIAQGVTISWAGANCDPQPERPSHQVVCRVLEKATLTVANPRGGVGARMTGTVSVFRVPPPV